MELSGFQSTIRATYHERDAARGVDGTFRWFTEEVGELAKAIRIGDAENLAHEVGDVLAWLTTVADLVGVEIDQAAARYAAGCPRCGSIPCGCDPA